MPVTPPATGSSGVSTGSTTNGGGAAAGTAEDGSPRTGWAPYRPGRRQEDDRWSAQPGAAHRPGAIPLRPLGLGQIYDGAFRIIRTSPRATVGAAVVVTAIALVLPLLFSVVLTFGTDLSVDLSADSSQLSDDEALGLGATWASLVIGAVLTWIGLTLVTATIAHVVHAAAVGRRMSLEASWDATRGKRWRILGLTLVVLLAVALLWAAYAAVLLLLLTVNEGLGLTWGILGGIGTVVLMAWLWIRLFYLPIPILTLEPVGVLGAMGRSWRLTKGRFWPTFGTAVLTWLVGVVAGVALTTPLQLVFDGLTRAMPEYALLLLVLGQSVGTVLQNAFVGPFNAGVVTLQYIDLRMRKEAYDVELMAQAGLLPR